MHNNGHLSSLCSADPIAELDRVRSSGRQEDQVDPVWKQNDHLCVRIVAHTQT